MLRESQVQPLLLVFEDLHWIDAETQALLDSLVESLLTSQLLLLVNYRPEYQHGWDNKTYYTQLRLDPLPPESADDFLQALLGDDPSLAPLKQLLIARTEGNPFFLEESVRTLVETGVLVGEPGPIAGPTPCDACRCRPRCRPCWRRASIDCHRKKSGSCKRRRSSAPRCPCPCCRPSPNCPRQRCIAGLAHLQAAELLYETRLFPERVYTFKHALTHEVAYGSLLQERRRALHAQIVEALETLAGDRVDEQVDRLAHHALRGEVWDKALAYCRQAGAKALARSAYREAVGCFEQALEALAHLPPDRTMLEQAIDLRCDLYQALVPLGTMGAAAHVPARRGNARRRAGGSTPPGTRLPPYSHGTPADAGL